VTNSKNCSSADRQKRAWRRLLLLGGIFLIQSGYAGEVLDSYVGTHEDHFLLRIDMLIDADTERVRQLLTDYAHLDQLSQSITRSEVLESQPPNYRIRVTTDGCILFFCRELVQVQDVTELNDGYILVTVVPEMSDFSYSRNMWRIRKQNDDTRVTYSSDLVPGFWIPPLIGTSLFKHKLLEDTHLLIENLERLANLPHDSTQH
jgi:hypothetical protein